MACLLLGLSHCLGRASRSVPFLKIPMKSRLLALILAVFALSVIVAAADRYNGPIPPKTDLPYLMHADNLVPTEIGVAKQEDRKDGTAFVLPGATSSARTPLAEPIFIIKTNRLMPDRLSAFKLDVKGGGREVFIPNKRGKNSKPIPLKVTRLSDGLYKVEVDNPIENGQYVLSPEGSNDAFAFEVY